VKNWQEKGVLFGVGTDSVASNNSLNMPSEIKQLAISQFQMSPKDILFGATRGGFLMQGRENSGYVKEGFDADLLLVDLTAPNLTPAHNIVNNLAFSVDSGNILKTMCDGEILYENGRFPHIEIEEITTEVSRYTAETLAKL
jgi:5-methylthioadenosine/S-adenosylhomocysteine deaminase